MAGPRKLATIAPDRPFLDTLAARLLAQEGDGAEALADHTILLPTRRACRALVDAFLRAGGGRPLLLPRIRPLGDIDEDDVGLAPGEETVGLDLPPAMPDARRRLLLARLILAWRRRRGEDVAPDQALRLAAELARFIDRVQTERLGFDGLAALVPEEHASHWQDTLDFLEIVTERWPQIVEEEGCLDPAERRNRLLAHQAEAWRREPPRRPVIAAGSTGSIPATADLLEVVADLPAGLVILPGLDRDMDERTRAEARADPAHPQHGMLCLLERLELDPRAVAEWGAEDGSDATAGPSPRVRLAAEALRPAATTDAWRDLGQLPVAAHKGVERVDCANEAEEAGVVALMLRHALEVPGRSAALVTPDRRLARRVAAELLRWGVAVDDSAGRPLPETPPGEFLRLVARAAAAGFPPVALLAALKHPLADGGMAPARFRRLVRAFEVAALRGPRPAPGIEGLRELVVTEPGQARRFAPLLDGLERRLGPLARELGGRDRPLAALIEAHVAAAEALAETDTLPGAALLWAGEDGEAAANAVAEMHRAAGSLGSLAGAEYPALFETMLSAATPLRPRFGRHPRLHIWGPLEARLQHADLMVLAGLNESTWPADPGNDPWLSRPMRAAFGLPSPERRIGLAAHDFAQAFAAPRVALVRAVRVEGAPTVPSRWLTRLDTVLEGAGEPAALAPAKPWRALYHALSRPERVERIAPPAPRPPVEARPRRLSVTRVETWMRDPYAVFAEQILGLRALDPLEADPGAAERGSFIHAALDAFVRETPGALPADAMARLAACGERAFGAALGRPAVRAFWWPRFLRVAAWFLDLERRRRGGAVTASATEVNGHITLPGPAGPFTLTAKADRIDRLADGGFAIIDYKTGLPPSEAQVALGYAPQLPLEALILAEGGFEGVERGAASELAYWRLSGGEPAGEICPLKGETTALADAARAGLAELIAAFDRPETPYLAVPRPEWAPAWNDYEHLARTMEWSAGGGGEP